jgi:YD repeat-containing protein
MNDTNKMTITDDAGREFTVEILLTFDGEDGQHFVLFTDPDDEEGNVYAYKYDEDGNLNAVEDDNEIEMCQEVLGAFQKENGEGHGA